MTSLCLLKIKKIPILLNDIYYGIRITLGWTGSSLSQSRRLCSTFHCQLSIAARFVLFVFGYHSDFLKEISVSSFSKAGKNILTSLFLIIAYCIDLLLCQVKSGSMHLGILVDRSPSHNSVDAAAAAMIRHLQMTILTSTSIKQY